MMLAGKLGENAFEPFLVFDDEEGRDAEKRAGEEPEVEKGRHGLSARRAKALHPVLNERGAKSPAQAVDEVEEGNYGAACLGRRKIENNDANIGAIDGG